MSKTNFPTRAAVLKHLQTTGWQVGRSAFYQHCDEGKLERDPDGSYSPAAVDRYASTFCRRLATGKRLSAGIAEQREAIRLEREKVRLKKEQRELELIEGKSIPAGEVERMIVGRAVAMLAHLRAMTQTRAGDWIHIVNGDHSRAPELIAEVWDNIEEHLATFARDVEFTVKFLPDGVVEVNP